MSVPSSACLGKVRSLGVCWYEGRILFQRRAGEKAWTLPGVDVYAEESKEALRIRIREELGAAIDVGTVLYVIEYFFDRVGTTEHELGVYFEFTFQPEFASLYEQSAFPGHSSDLEFRWIDESELDGETIAPVLLKQLLIDPPLHMQYLTEDARP